MTKKEEQNPLISESEIKKLGGKKRKVINDPGSHEEESIIESNSNSSGENYFNKAGKVLIKFESEGRFGNPKESYYSDYTIKHVNDITLSRTEDLLSNLIVILNEIRVNDGTPFDHKESLIEEFLEILVGIKLQYQGKEHTHRWICDCQNMLDPEDQIVNETIIDLSKLNYRSIQEAEEDLKKYVEKRLKELSQEQFNQYLINKYKKDPINIDEWSIEKEIESITIKEPISILVGNDSYNFRFNRLKDIVKAQEISQKEFAGKIKYAQSEKFKEGTSLVEYKAKKKKDVDDLKYQQAKAGILYTKALCLESINGTKLSDQQKIEKYQEIPRNIIGSFINLLNEIKFGIYHEQELVCPECGETSKRWLQQTFNPLEFLPLESATAGERNKSEEFNIFIGV